MVTNTVPSMPLGCCRATGQPATSTFALQAGHIDIGGGQYVGGQGGPHELHDVTPGIDAHDGVFTAIFSLAVKSGSSGMLPPVEIGRALCPFLGGRTGRPASQRASLRLAVTPSKAPAMTREWTAMGPESRPPHQVPGP